MVMIMNAERHHRIRVPGFATADDIGKVPAFPGQQASIIATGSTGVSSSTQQQQPQQASSGVGSGTGGGGAHSTATQSGAAANTAGNAGGAGASGKGKEKASAAAPTLRSKRLAAARQSTK